MSLIEEIGVRLPLFGHQKITLYEQVSSDDLSLSYYVYNKLKNNREIDRLNNVVMHLGVLHEIGDVPKFSRWNHITMMLVLIDKISKLYKENTIERTLDISFSSPVALKNKVKFKSAEDFLKCWSMLYSIGHFVGTFATEHALLKCVVANEKSKNNFLEALNKKFESYLSGNSVKNVRTVCEQIIYDENVFKVFKIFTLLKILEIFNCNNKEDEAIRELAIFSFLGDNYLDEISDPDQRWKLERLIDVFNLIRKISYLILDGYFSQNFVNVNPQWLILNISTVLNEEAHQKLLNDLNLFYTKIIYQSPENMYYHHKFVKIIEKLFKNKIKSGWSSLINQIINNKIDYEIEELLKELTKNDQNKPNHFARIIVKELSNPVLLENKLFDRIDGGIIYNISADYYEVDIYSKPKSLDDIFKICEIVSEIYREILSYKNNDLKFLIGGFEDVGKKLAITTLNTLRTPNSFDESWNYRCQKQKFDHSAIVFLRENVESVNEYLRNKIEKFEKSKSKKSDELEASLKLIDDLTKIYTDCNVLYVYIPKIEAISTSTKKTLAECDFMLLVYNLSKRCLNIHVAEIKSRKRGGVKKDQLGRYCIYFLVSDTDEFIRILENDKDKIISRKVRINVKSISKSKLISKTIHCKKF